MLFRKQIEPRCAYCIHSRELDETYVSCPKQGIVAGGYFCRKFAYDPLKRIPPRRTLPKRLSGLSLSDETAKPGGE